MSILIAGSTIIDGVANNPVEGKSIWIEGERIKAIARPDELQRGPDIEVIDARGKFVIPGLMNANVHLLCDVRLENLARYAGRYEDLITEAAQVALKNGLTTVFDTWGPRRHLMAVRDKINTGQLPGSRIFCSGNIVGFDGPFSEDFFAKAAEVASIALARRINATWVENVGRRLMWLTTDEVAKEIRAYIAKGIDFLKYGSNSHVPIGFIAFSPQVQRAMVDEAHRAGITAQSHTVSVEGLRMAIEAGCDLIQHANVTGPTPIPESTLDMLAARATGAVVFPFTQRRLAWLMENASDIERTMWAASDVNVRNLIRAGVPLLLANDGAIFAPERVTNSEKNWTTPGDDSLIDLDTGHFAWLRAMEEKGCPPMDILKAATRNIAVAYGKAKDLGSIEEGKVADMLILDENPLIAAENYRRIHMIIKDGRPVSRDALPVNPLLTKPMDATSEEEMSYVPFVVKGGKFPMCPCMCE